MEKWSALVCCLPGYSGEAQMGFAAGFLTASAIKLYG